MKRIVLDSINVYLTQSFFNAGAAIYVVKSDYKLNSKVVLPAGSELRIEGGSISLQVPWNQSPSAQSYGIYILCSNQEKAGSENYSTLCVTSRAAVRSVGSGIEGKQALGYVQTSSLFMKEGDYIKNVEPDNFEMKLTTDCRILLPKDTNKANLSILSNKVNTIQIDGKCNFQLHAKNCKFERIFACPSGMVLVSTVELDTITDNKDANKITYSSPLNTYSLFENCEIFASDGVSLDANDPYFLSIVATVDAMRIENPSDEYYENIQNKIHTLEIINSLVLQDCVISNIGLTGSVNIDNCSFLFGSNYNKNGSLIRVSKYSRIKNCIFDGREKIIGTPKLSADVIDIICSRDIIIEGCTFKAYSTLEEEDCSVIRLTSQYYIDTTTENTEDENNKIKVSQNGVSIKNCFF